MGEHKGEESKNGSSSVKQLTGLRGDDKIKTPPQPPDLEGYLDKLKHKTTLLGSWNRRWFVVDARSRALVYYASKQAHRQGGEPSGSIPLRDVKAVRLFDDTTFQVESSGRTFMLRADSKAELTCWLTAFEEFIPKQQDYERWNVVYEASRPKAAAR